MAKAALRVKCIAIYLYYSKSKEKNSIIIISDIYLTALTTC